MEEHPNAVLVRSLFAAFRDADAAAIEGLIPDGVVWHFPGRTGALAGDHLGRDAVLQFLLRVVELTGGTFHLDLIDVVANDRTAIALFEGRGERAGRTLRNPTCLRMRIEGGRIVELWEYVWDLYDVDDFWS